MGKLRCKTLTVAKGFLLTTIICLEGAVGFSDSSAESGETMGGTIRMELAAGGALSVTNDGDDIELRRDLLVEKKDPATSSWIKLDAYVRLVATCDGVEAGATRILRRGETLVVVAWNGWSCDGQCLRPCRANIYYGPGEFRLVVLSVSGGQRFEGPGFHLEPVQG